MSSFWWKGEVCLSLNIRSTGISPEIYVIPSDPLATNLCRLCLRHPCFYCLTSSGPGSFHPTSVTHEALGIFARPLKFLLPQMGIYLYTHRALPSKRVQVLSQTFCYLKALFYVRDVPHECYQKMLRNLFILTRCVFF